MKWDVCVEQLAAELTAEQLNTWIKPLQVEESAQSIYLFAPNRFVKDWVADRYLDRIQSFYSQHVGGTFHVSVQVGSSNGGDSSLPSTASAAAPEKKDSGIRHNKALSRSRIASQRLSKDQLSTVIA